MKLIKKKPERKLRLIKKEADSWFSLYIRLKNSDWRGYTTCYTCGHVSHYKKGMQCGHFASRRFLNTRFDEENVRVQCLTKDSKLKIVNGAQKSIDKISVGDKIEAFDEKTFKKTGAIVKSTKSFIPNKLYLIEMEDGSSFFSTGDHRVVAGGRWRSIDSMLHSCIECDILEI